MALLRLDPKIPVVWRDPFTLQLGGDPPLLVLERISPREERMLTALRAGIPRSALHAVGPSSVAAADEFLARLRPFLLREAPPELAFAVRARGRHQELIGATARSLGLIARHDAPPARRRAGIVVGMHAIPRSDYRDWLRRDLPHVGVVFGDERVLVSAVTVPGRTACLRCADLWRRDADPEWPALATQLIAGPAASALDPILRAEALGAAARLLAEAVGVPGPPSGHGLVLTVRGRVDQLPPTPHPECGCTFDLATAPS
jgi:hypothetical protein